MTDKDYFIPHLRRLAAENAELRSEVRKLGVQIKFLKEEDEYLGSAVRQQNAELLSLTVELRRNRRSNMTDNAESVRPADTLRGKLNAVTRNTYCVNEKVPPSYQRKWKLYVLWNDGTNDTFWGDDSEVGHERVYRDALRLAPELTTGTQTDG